MSQVIENRSVVWLTPLSQPSEGPGPGWVSCRVRVDEAVPVEGYPNLLGAILPRELEALVPEPEAILIVVDHPVRAIASLAGPGRLRIEQAQSAEEDPVPAPAEPGDAVEEPGPDD